MFQCISFLKLDVSLVQIPNMSHALYLCVAIKLSVSSNIGSNGLLHSNVALLFYISRVPFPFIIPVSEYLLFKSIADLAQNS